MTCVWVFVNIRLELKINGESVPRVPHYWWSGPSGTGAVALHRWGKSPGGEVSQIANQPVRVNNFCDRSDILARVAIVMGSDSDLPVMKDAADVLKSFDIDFEVEILSAHRLPNETAAFAESAEEKGLQVIIAGAGGAAHLAGVIAAQTTVPVIGVPMMTSTLSGIDSLYSMVQMPKGIPVATVAINGAANAALLAIQIMGTSDSELRRKIKDYRYRLADEVRTKGNRLRDFGIDGYLLQKGGKR